MQRLIIVTGASRGIGATIALESNKKFSTGTLFLLIARDEDKLTEIRNKMASESSENKIINLKLDFNHEFQTSEIVKLIKLSLDETDLKAIKELFVFYNHGTLKLGSLQEIADFAKHEFQINVISVWTLMSALKDLFPLDLVPLQFHVNISSLLATLVQKDYSAYNTTRSARATLFRCLAVEEPKFRVLNYQPGPVYTDMQKQIYDKQAESNAEYKELYEQGKFVQPEDTVKRLWGILDKNSFENGTAIDFYDTD